MNDKVGVRSSAFRVENGGIGKRALRKALTPDAARRTPDFFRSGFSLIEILVVLGLIAFLTAAIVVVLPRVSNTAKVAATRATIKKVDELLNDRINGFQRWIQTQNTLAGNNIPGYVTSAGYTATQYKANPPLYQMLGAKSAFRTAFPQNFKELGPAFVAKDQTTESAACLYIILTQKAVFDTEPPAAGDMRGVEVADTDLDGRMEIVDAWGHPLRFYRWPTRLFRPATSAGTAGTPQVDLTNWNSLSPAPAPTPASILVRSAPRGPLPKWTANTSYSAPTPTPPGSIVQPATIIQNNAQNVMMYQCSVAGTSGGSEPNPWGMTVGVSMSDGTVTWVPVLDPLAIDSDDPNGLASSTLVNESNFHTWGTYHVPLIVSCGTDETLGLYEPYDTATFGTLAQPKFDTTGTDSTGFARNDLYDDLTNHQQ